MSEFAVEADSTLWYEVPDAAGAERFVAERTAGLSDADWVAAFEAVQFALVVRAEGDDLTLLLQEPESSLYAVVVFSLLEGSDVPTTENEAVQLVTGGDIGPWAPTVVPVELGEHRGYRVSELVVADSAPEGEFQFQAIDVTQTTYVLSVGGQLAVVALSPAPAPSAGLVLAMIEPVLASWQAVPRV